MATRKYAVGVWNKQTKKYEVHHKTDVLEYAQAVAELARQKGATTIVLIAKD